MFCVYLWGVDNCNGGGPGGVKKWINGVGKRARVSLSRTVFCNIRVIGGEGNYMP